jgi:hypothetical protein
MSTFTSLLPSPNLAKSRGALALREREGRAAERRDILGPFRHPSGAFAMLAIDQRESMRAMFAEKQSAAVEDRQLSDFKILALEALTHHASAVLIDRPFAWDRAIAERVVAPSCALIAAADHFIASADEIVADVEIDTAVAPERIRADGRRSQAARGVAAGPACRQALGAGGGIHRPVQRRRPRQHHRAGVAQATGRPCLGSGRGDRRRGAGAGVLRRRSLQGRGAAAWPWGRGGSAATMRRADTADR